MSEDDRFLLNLVVVVAVGVVLCVGAIVTGYVTVTEAFVRGGYTTCMLTGQSTPQWCKP